MNTKILFILFLCLMDQAFAQEPVGIDPTTDLGRNERIKYNEKYDYWSIYLYKEKKRLRLCFPPAVALVSATTSKDGTRFFFTKNLKDDIYIAEIMIDLHVNSSVDDYIEKMGVDESFRLVGEEVVDTYEVRHYGVTFAKNFIQTLITITPDTYIITAVHRTANGDWYKDMINGDLCRE